VFLSIHLLAFISDEEYFVFKKKDYSIIYTKEYQKEASFIKINIDNFLKKYQESYNVVLDEPLDIVLIGDNLQIANAYSTQTPFNLITLYNNGSNSIDYFSATSRIAALFGHELAHSYQINAKGSKVSKKLHQYLGNNEFPLFFGLPFFTLPNELLPTFLIEGNAVYFESIISNGGRLHNGALNALKNALLFDDKIIANRLINNHLEFPYRKEKYIIGGFYMQYLAQEFGENKVNSFFYEHSKHFINPLLINESFKNHFGVGFHQSIKDFVKKEKERYQDYKIFYSKLPLAKSKSKIVLNKEKDSIYFISHNLITRAVLHEVTKDKHYQENTTLLNGKVFHINNKAYTNSNAFINDELFKNALFDKKEKAFFIGRDIQDIKGNTMAYIDVKHSLLDQSLYVNDTFFTKVNSSVLMDKYKNIYYFKQKKDRRILYKNKTALTSFLGYYGKVVDIIGDKIYCIANTKNGSSLYLFDKKWHKIIEADNIVDAKYLDKETILIVTIQSDGYYVYKIKTAANSKEINPYYSKIKQSNFEFNNAILSKDLNSTAYKPFNALRFSKLKPSFEYNNNGLNLGFMALWEDPISFNQLSIYGISNKRNSQGGISYKNEQIFPFSIAYSSNKKNYFLDLGLYETLVHQSKQQLKVKAHYLKNTKRNYQKAFISTLLYEYSEFYNKGSQPYRHFNIKYILKKGGETTYGFNLNMGRYIGYEFYINSAIKYRKSDNNEIKILGNNTFFTKDETDLRIQSINYSTYVNAVNKQTLGLSKTFHYHSYFTIFPVSLLEEELVLQHNRYIITQKTTFKKEENIFGLNAKLLFLHKYKVPLKIRYINNDFFEKENQIIFKLGIAF
jgi:hypothetical protein